jgi:sugar lactone lactonase YvrE
VEVADSQETKLMNIKHRILYSVLGLGLGFTLTLQAQPVQFEVVASGLNNPRGLAFGPEGALYVAEAGLGGDGNCIIGGEQNEVCYGPSGSVTRIWKGKQERVVTGLPSVAAEGGARAGGPVDISFQGNGNGLVSIGLGTNPEKRVALGPEAALLGHIIKLRPNGKYSDVADISGYEVVSNPDGGAIDSNPYSVLAEPGMTIVADAGANALVGVRANGKISTLAVFPSRMVDAPPFLQLPPGTQIPMQAVPNCVAKGPDGAYYVGELTGFPFTIGAARVYRVSPGSDPEVFADDFTNIIDIDFGPDGSLYVLEIDANGLATPGSDAALIRVSPDGTRTIVASAGLVAPTGVVIGPDGAAYVSNFGIFPGIGQVVRISL